MGTSTSSSTAISTGNLATSSRQLWRVKSPDLAALAAAEPVARLATAGSGGKPHIVPICFAIEGSRLYFAIDQKPKSGRPLRRLANIEANPQVSILVDHYEEDWSRLWWIRLDGIAAVL